jgi:hypothetical protein
VLADAGSIPAVSTTKYKSHPVSSGGFFILRRRAGPELADGTDAGVRRGCRRAQLGAAEPLLRLPAQRLSDSTDQGKPQRGFLPFVSTTKYKSHPVSSGGFFVLRRRAATTASSIWIPKIRRHVA